MSTTNKINWLFIFLVIAEWFLSKILDASFTSVRITLMFLVIAINYKDSLFRHVLSTGAVGIWGIWTLFSIINWFICPHRPLEYPIYVTIASFLKCYIFLAVLVYEATLDYRGALRKLLKFFCVLFFVGILGQGNGPVKETAAWEGRSGTLLGNHFPNAMICGLFAAFIARKMDVIGKKYFYLSIVAVTGVVLWVATRKAMYGIFILCIFYVLSSIDLKKKSNIAYLFGGASLIFIAYQLVMKYTLLGTRVSQMGEYDYSSYVPTYLQFLGDRAIQYVLAWNVFLEHPINGVGLGNSMDYTGLPFPLHTEYMAQLCEGGIIGAGLFIIYIRSILKGIYGNYKYGDKFTSIIIAGGLTMLLFLALTAWLYNMSYFFIVYALVIAYCNPLKNK